MSDLRYKSSYHLVSKNEYFLFFSIFINVYKKFVFKNQKV